MPVASNAVLTLLAGSRTDLLRQMTARHIVGFNGLGLGLSEPCPKFKVSKVPVLVVTALPDKRPANVQHA